MLTSSSAMNAATRLTASARHRLGSAPSGGGTGNVAWPPAGAARRGLPTACPARAVPARGEFIALSPSLDAATPALEQRRATPGARHHRQRPSSVLLAGGSGLL